MVIRHWRKILEPIDSIVIASFDRRGMLAHGNAGLRRIAGESCSLWQLMTQPHPDAVVNAEPDGEGRLWSGLITVRDRNGGMLTLNGEIYRESDRIVLAAGYDMQEFETLSTSLLELNEEINAAYRDLARTNRKLEIREREIRQISLTDQLTGVGNRRRLDEALATEVERATRFSQPLSLMIVDIDHFKRVNDTWGHEAGDRVLKETGAVLLSLLRQSDIATRLGGEEFVVLLPVTDAGDAVICAERFRGVLAARDFGLPEAVTSSFGVSCLLPGESGAAMLARADAALYEAKQQGRNRVVAATPDRRTKIAADATRSEAPAEAEMEATRG